MPLIRCLLVLAGLASVPAYADTECRESARFRAVLELMPPDAFLHECPAPVIAGPAEPRHAALLLRPKCASPVEPVWCRQADSWRSYHPDMPKPAGKSGP